MSHINVIQEDYELDNHRKYDYDFVSIRDYKIVKPHNLFFICIICFHLFQMLNYNLSIWITIRR
jgi:hypothetical protein